MTSTARRDFKCSVTLIATRSCICESSTRATEAGASSTFSLRRDAVIDTLSSSIKSEESDKLTDLVSFSDTSTL